MTTPLRLLIVEDSPDDAELVRFELERGGFELESKRVETEEDFLAALDESWDLIISDYQMPAFNGLRAFELFQEREIDIPFIFVSGALGEERAVEAMRAGAKDYLLKGNLARLNVAVKRELRDARSRAERRAAREAARREERRLAMAVQASGAGVFEHRVPAGTDTHVTERYAEILGLSVDELPPDGKIVEWVFDRTHPEDTQYLKQAYSRFVRGETERYEVEFRVAHRDGAWVDVALFGDALSRDADGRATHVVGVMLDLTERRKLEEQLQQAQKMESIGRLAGGVAHDFNNLLTAIFSFAEFVKEGLHEEDPAREDLNEVIRAAEKAQSLTSQLLAFSRRKPVSPKVIDINGVVCEMDRMLRRIMGEDVDVSTTLAPDLWNIRIDPGSLEQIIVNLAVNARDAMTDGGKLTIETQNIELDEEYNREKGVEVPAGEYVVVSMSDDGTGMDEETQHQIFEPFFTTKGAGKGTGLGLSTCYGIVRQAEGYIWVYSEPGDGTTFRIYLPRATGEADVLEERRAPSDVHGSETILVVEDDDQVRRLAVRGLERQGYDVVAAANGGEALLLCENRTEKIDLLLTDVVMPGMSGKQLVQRLTSICPHLKILYMSGYTENAIVHRGVLEPETNLLQKPFTPDSLARKVREILDE